MDPGIQAALLKDPAVQEAVKKAGKDALMDPNVQQQILDVCKEKFPEAAMAAKEQIVKWANDPEVQKQAYHYAGLAMDAAWKSVEQVTGLIEQGPAGVRILAFCGALASVANVVLRIALAPLAVVSNITHIYQLCFALTTMLFEAKPEWIAKAGRGLDDYQHLLIDKAKFLSETLGRGLFYGFQGVLWLYFSSITELLNFGLGCWFLFMAFLHICMHFGIMPQEVAKKIQSVRTMVSHDLGKPGDATAASRKSETDVEQGGGGFFSFLGALSERRSEPEAPVAVATTEPAAAAAPSTASKEEAKTDSSKPPEAEPLLGADAAPKPGAPAAAGGKKPATKGCCSIQ